MTIQPTYSNVLVEMHDAKTTTDLILPQSAKAILPYGLVIACGPDCKIVKFGQKVLFNFGLGQPYGTHPNDKKLLINEGLIEAFYIDEVELIS